MSEKPAAKKPMSNLHSLIAEQIKLASVNLMKQLLENMIDEKMPNAPQALKNALVEHILTNPSEKFQWDQQVGDEYGISIRITDADIEPIISRVMQFVEKEMPDAIRLALSKIGHKFLKSLLADWPEQRAHEEVVKDNFRANLEDRWGKAFDVLRMIYTISLEVGQSVTKQHRRSKSIKNAAMRKTLFQLHARACQVSAEIITLIENGFADGAMARWRTLHEIAVVAALIVEHGNELALRYQAHAVVESKRAMDRFLLNHSLLGYAAPSQQEVDQINCAFEASLEKFGNSFGSQYGWAAHHLSMKKPRFDDLQGAVGKIEMRSYYIMASYNVHASTKGVAFRLGLMDGGHSPVALAGASNAGFVEPVGHTAHDLIFMTGLLLHGNWRFDHIIEMHILLALRDRLPVELGKAQRALKRAHFAQVRRQEAATARHVQRTARR